MPQEDPAYDPDTVHEYECLNCGTVVRAADATECPNCGGTLRNRALPME